MNAEGLHQALREVAGIAGLQGCALVEIDAGMVWHAVGEIAELQKIAEVSTDYWRLYQRHKVYFEQLGELRAQVMMHRNVRITMQPCGQDMLLIVLSHAQDVVDRGKVQTHTQELKRLMTNT